MKENENRYVVVCEADGYYYSGDPGTSLMAFTDDRLFATAMSRETAEAVASEFSTPHRVEAA